MALCLSDSKGYFQVVNLKNGKCGKRTTKNNHYPIPSACQDGGKENSNTLNQM